MSGPRIGVLHCGASYHLTTLADPRMAELDPRELYLPAVAGDPAAALAGLDRVLVLDRLHPGLLARCTGALTEVPARGGTLVVLGDATEHTWLPGVRARPTETNFWWWRTGEDPGIRTRLPEHPVWAHVPPTSTVWHHHGLLYPPADADRLTIVTAPDAEEDADPGAILYHQAWPRPAAPPGRLLAAAMDPSFHHGSNFMPAATSLLHGILTWLSVSA